MRRRMWLAGMVMLALDCAVVPAAERSLRRVVCLDGTWQIAEGTLNTPPSEYRHTIPVPGLADMATPRFESPGSSVSLDDRGKPWLRPADPRREAFWYRRTFTLDGPPPAVAKLKVHKARYGTQVFLNGKPLGDHGPNFTPGWFDARPALKGHGAQNELLIRVGASLAQVPLHLTDGWDNEKSRYLPGIYDSVELILCGAPHVESVQTVPDVENKAVRAVVALSPGASGPVKAVVHEARSGRVAGQAAAEARGAGKVELTIPIGGARPWTPEDPFLYELVVHTAGNTARTRFGLRSFTTDPASGRTLLNGRPYFLRGSNVCIYRFFEDAARGGLPWDRAWVRKLHRRFKEMHWNALRYCIGFPPELWYEIADEEGVLIQDEFPIWYSRAKGGWPEAITAEHLAAEFTEWIRERWNHPCVVIWDAQNETANDRVIAAAMAAVRDLDLSRRPWDNGWGTPQRPGDISEAHPYRSGRGTLARLGDESGIPDNGPKKPGAARPPYLINEYGWLWINRDGSLPTLTVDVYKRLLGENATVAERFQYYARALAAKTELWRHRRKCAGVLHFCGLGYSRADGQTSDNFADVRELIYEPNFHQYVRDSFAPVGVMLDFWKEQVAPGQELEFPVSVINDLYDAQSGSVRLRVLRGDRVLYDKSRPVTVAALGQEVIPFAWRAPQDEGPCRLEAALAIAADQTVRSLRDVTVAVPQPPPAVKASSELTDATTGSLQSKADVEISETVALAECHSLWWAKTVARPDPRKPWTWYIDPALWQKAVQQKGEGKKEDCSFNLWVPGGLEFVKGVVAISGHGSGRRLYSHPELREIARQLRLALVMFLGNPVQRGFWPTSILYDRLKAFGEKSHHAELAHAPLFLYGHSNGTGFAAVFPAAESARVWAWVSMRPGTTAQVHQPGAAQVPGMIMFGEQDPYFARPSQKENLAVVETMRKDHAALWHCAVEPGTGHGPGEKSWPLVFSFLRHTWAARVPADCDPRKGPVKLIALQQASGYLGKNWDFATGGCQTLTTAPFAGFAGDKSSASWLLNAAYAGDWQEFQCLRCTPR